MDACWRGVEWHPTSESGDSSSKTTSPLLYLKYKPTTPTVVHNQCWLLCRVLLLLLVCLVWCECTWGPVTVGYCCIICLTVTVWQTLQALLLSCSVHSSCHSVNHSVLYCSLFTPAVWCSATNTCTEVWSGSCERGCQKQEHCRVQIGAYDTWPKGSWWYTSTTHTRREEEVQSWSRILPLHWALSQRWEVHRQSLNAVSVLCQSSPQSVVPEKQPLPPQLHGCAGWVHQLSLVCGPCTSCSWYRAF